MEKKSNLIDIKGIDKIDLLEALWMYAGPEIPGLLGGLFAMVEFNRTKAFDALWRDTYVDYWQGRPIKTDLGGDKLDPYCYDLNSRHKCKDIVDAVKKNEIVYLSK